MHRLGVGVEVWSGGKGRRGEMSHCIILHGRCWNRCGTKVHTTPFSPRRPDDGRRSAWRPPPLAWMPFRGRVL